MAAWAAFSSRPIANCNYVLVGLDVLRRSMWTSAIIFFRAGSNTLCESMELKELCLWASQPAIYITVIAAILLNLL